ncbi:MAG: PIN domain-containing protein [Trueperaceae bacterium]|nr:PIN domain-containing protein [Trueperaceae bacterium]
MGTRILSGRYVFDTNVVVSALLFDAGRLISLRAAWATGAVVPIVSQATSTELLRVLAYPKFRLDPADRAELLADDLPFAELVTGAVPRASVLAVHPDGQPFVDPCVASRADGIVSGDGHPLSLGPAVPVVRPADLLARLLPSR